MTATKNKKLLFVLMFLWLKSSRLNWQIYALLKTDRNPSKYFIILHLVEGMKVAYGCCGQMVKDNQQRTKI